MLGPELAVAGPNGDALFRVRPRDHACRRRPRGGRRPEGLRRGDPRMKNAPWFTRFAKKTAQLSGRPGTFCLAVAVILLWLATGPLFDYSDTWQLIINTGTTIITFLMVFL